MRFIIIKTSSKINNDYSLRRSYKTASSSMIGRRNVTSYRDNIITSSVCSTIARLININRAAVVPTMEMCWYHFRGFFAVSNIYAYHNNILYIISL